MAEIGVPWGTPLEWVGVGNAAPVTGGGGGGTDPPPIDPNTSWQEAWDTDDQTTIDAWYEMSTGWDGYVDPDLGRKLVSSDLTNHAGGFSTSSNGQVIEKVRFTNLAGIGGGHDDVVFRGCEFHFSASTALFNQWAGDNLTLEHCTFYGTSTTAANGRVAYFRGSNVNATVRYCKVPNDSLVGSAFLRIEECMGGTPGVIAEYNYIRWLGSNEGRCTAIALRCDNVGIRNITLRRNNIRGRASACVTNYNRGTSATNPDAHFENVTWEQNLFNTLDRDLRQGEPYALYSWPQNWFDGAGYTVYATRFGQSTQGGLQCAPHVNMRVVNNKWGRWSYPACGGASPAISAGFGSSSNTWSGNRFLDGDKASIDPSGSYNYSPRDGWTFEGDPETTGRWVRN